MNARPVAASTVQWLEHVDASHPAKNEIVTLVWSRIRGFVTVAPNGRLYLNRRGQDALDARPAWTYAAENLPAAREAGYDV